MTARIVVTGAGGRLGAALVRAFSNSSAYAVLGLARTDLDLADPESIRSRLGGETFSALVNCAALTQVDYCETHADEAQRVNADAVGELARLCRERGARFVHISTDYVFAGDRPDLLREEDPAEPRSVYGRTKRDGEQQALAADPNHLVARVSWVFGPDRPSFVDQIVRRALEEDRVEAVADKFSSPSYTADLALWIEALLRTPAAAGLVHLCNRGVCSWRDYGQFALDELARLGVALRCREVAPIRLAEMKAFVAERPVHTAMDTARFEEWTGLKPRSWRDAVAEYLARWVLPRLTQPAGGR